MTQQSENGKQNKQPTKHGLTSKSSSPPNMQKRTCKNKLTAKQFKVNLIKVQAEAAKELIANLTKVHTKQMKLLIESMTKSMKEMINLMKALVKSPKTTNSDEKKKSGKRNSKYIRTHPYANIATRNTPKTRKQMLGTRDKCILLPNQLEIHQKHLKVCGVFNGKRELATGESTQ
jgi:hypothetical protein